MKITPISTRDNKPMQAKTFLVQADNCTPQVIKCSIWDQLLKNIPVSVVFFYRQSIAHNLLINSLQKILSDFPIFAGVLKSIDGNLHLDCNNQGVQFSVTEENSNLEQVLHELPTIKKQRLVPIINSKKVISNGSPILLIKLTYFTCGGMVLGLSWHHSIGDMHTFMSFMQAWSNVVNQQEYIAPLIVKERDEYLQDNLEQSGQTIPDVRYLNTRKLLSLMFYLLFPSRNKLSLRFYFSEQELKSMKQNFCEKTKRKLSKNDVLCAHLFNVITKSDAYEQKRYLSIAVNYRSRMKLPQNLLGNFISTVNILGARQANPFELARDIRSSIDNFKSMHFNPFATKKYIEQNGGIKKIDRFVATSIDPLNRTLLISNWANFGVYNITFGDLKPFYFTSLVDCPFPWLSGIVEGFSENGLIYSVLLPSKLAKKLMQVDSLKEIHKYRSLEEIMPELVRELEWLL
jgi:shikimate O-hydroxycinnamoyltransferase